MNLDLIILPSQTEEIRRKVSLTNDEWLILSQCVESFSETYRSRHSQVIATYVTRGQLEEAVIEGQKMNNLLKRLDQIQISLL